MSKRIENIRLAVQAMHRCLAKHESSAPIIEMFGKNKVWEGVVEIFLLVGHPKAKRCYAWDLADDSSKPRYIAVLELPPVHSPHTAVRAAIASGEQK
jgi:hypothetical protein